MMFMTIQPKSDLSTDLLILNSAQPHEKEVIEAVFECTIDEVFSGSVIADENFRYKTFDMDAAIKEFSKEELERGHAYRRYLV